MFKNELILYACMKLKMVAVLVSSRVLSCYNDTNRPKFIQNEYSNGRIDLVHYLKNGTSVKTMIKKPKPTFFQRIKSYLPL